MPDGITRRDLIKRQAAAGAGYVAAGALLGGPLADGAGASSGPAVHSELYPLPGFTPEIDLRGKTAQFEVTVKEVREPKLPEIDAEFLKEQSCESWHIVVVPPSAVDRMEGRGRVVDVVSKVFDERDDDEPVLRCSCDPLDEVRVLGTRFAA